VLADEAGVVCRDLRRVATPEGLPRLGDPPALGTKVTPRRVAEERPPREGEVGVEPRQFSEQVEGRHRAAAIDARDSTDPEAGAGKGLANAVGRAVGQGTKGIAPSRRLMARSSRPT
jgi:hypothetical protein